MKFKELKIGSNFEYGGNLWIKKSSRTAWLIRANRLFYMGQNDICKLEINVSNKYEFNHNGEMV